MAAFAGPMVRIRLPPAASPLRTDFSRGGSRTVSYFRPPPTRTAPPVVIAMHGFDRAASDFRYPTEVIPPPDSRLSLSDRTFPFRGAHCRSGVHLIPKV